MEQEANNSMYREQAEDSYKARLGITDAKVKLHEKTHMALLGGAAGGGIQYSYAVGPDGERFAVGGSIKVDLSPVPGNPEATLRKARLVRLAALGPGSPSPADMRVATDAYRLEMEAKKEIKAGNYSQLA